MSSTLDRLVMMANQIGKFFEPQREGDPVAGIADHLREVLGPAHAGQPSSPIWRAGGAGLDGPVREAVQRLKEGT